MPDGGDLLDRARTVAGELRERKRAARHAREAVQAAAAELARIKAECARLGIAFVMVPEPVPGRVGKTGRA